MRRPGSSRFCKGALVTIELGLPPVSVVPFQYNPEKIVRQVRARGSEGSQAETGGESHDLPSPPSETLTLGIELDATDALDEGSVVAKAAGVGPALAALEMLLHPSIKQAFALTKPASTKLIAKRSGAVTLLVWGPERAVPVRLTGLEITEQEFDALLNPIRASVSLSLNVLTYSDPTLSDLGRGLAFRQHVVKQALSVLYGSVTDLGAAVVPLAERRQAGG